MNARLAGLITALETIVVVGIGVGIFFAPLTLVWAFEDNFSTDFLAYWRASADLWLLGHGVPLQFSLDPVLAASLGLTDAEQAFPVSIAPLGPALLTLWWGFRMGRRELVIEHPIVVWLTAIAVHTALSYALHVSAWHELATTPVIDALIRPTLFLAAGMVLAQWTAEWSLGRRVLSEILPPPAWQVIRTAALAGTASVVMVMGVAGVGQAIMLIAGYAKVVSLYQALQPGILGVVALSIAQMALLPTVTVWTAAWFIGPGFSLGQNAVFSPLATDVQAVPALPMLAALPVGGEAVGMGVVALPILAAVISGALASRALEHRVDEGLWKPMDRTGFFAQPAIRIVVTAALGTAFALAWALAPLELASGSLGPGRFAEAGVDSGRVLLWWALEAGAGMLVGLFLGEALTRIRAAEARSLQKSTR